LDCHTNNPPHPNCRKRLLGRLLSDTPLATPRAFFWTRAFPVHVRCFRTPCALPVLCTSGASGPVLCTSGASGPVLCTSGASGHVLCTSGASGHHARYLHCAFPVHFPCISRAFPVHFPCISIASGRVRKQAGGGRDSASLAFPRPARYPHSRTHPSTRQDQSRTPCALPALCISRAFPVKMVTRVYDTEASLRVYDTEASREGSPFTLLSTFLLVTLNVMS